jgi:hypothetical protein
VHALAGQRVQVRRQRRDERLALAGAHLGDVAAVQHHAADHLHVEVTHLEDASAGLAHDRERLGQDLVERLAAIETTAELAGHARELLVVLRFHRRLELGDAPDDGVELLQLARVLGPENLLDESANHGGGFLAQTDSLCLPK